MHFSYERSHEHIMVVDMQGSDRILFDPEITSEELLDGEWPLTAISNFSENDPDCNTVLCLVRTYKIFKTKSLT